MKIRNHRRKGVAAIEFALTAPLFLLCLFACIDYSRLLVSISFVEIAATKTVRHLSVLGATKSEAQEFAANELRMIGIDDFNIEISALNGDSLQNDIDDSTTSVAAEITVPIGEVTFLTSLFFEADIIRTSKTRTNKPHKQK